MAKKYWILLSVSFISICVLASQQAIDCSNFKYGKFVSSFSKRSGMVLSIQRGVDGMQIEHVQKGKLDLTIKYRVVWRSPCNYVLKYVSTNAEKQTIFKQGDSVEVDILRIISSNAIKVKSEYRGYVMYDTLTKVD